MFATKLAPAYDTLLDFLVEKATPQEILAFELNPKEIARAEELSDKSNAGRLSDEEEAELTSILDIELFIGALRARALVALKSFSVF